MRKLLPLAALSLFVAACADTPTNPLEDAPVIQATVIGDNTITGLDDPLCDGLSPCDAFDYDRDDDGSPDGIVGIAGYCFLSPVVGNHLGDPACSGDFIGGLEDFELVVARVDYANGPDAAPTVDGSTIIDRSPLVENVDGEFYASSLQFRRKGNSSNPLVVEEGSTFRLYVVREGVVWAHRDVIVDPNLTTPADGYVKAIGYGNEPIKVRITQDVGCSYFDTQFAGTDNAATCLINGESQEFTLGTQGDQVITTFTFNPGNEPFLLDFEVSECRSLGYEDDITGNFVPLVDAPLADCKISIDAGETGPDRLTVPAEVDITLTDSRWLTATGPYAFARINVLQTDEFGTAALPPTAPEGWFGDATPASGDLSGLAMHWIGRGLEGIAGLLLPEPLSARPSRSFSWDALSDFQIFVAAQIDFPEQFAGTACASGLASCLDLGTFSGANPTTTVSAQVTAPVEYYGDLGLPVPPGDLIDVPGARIHFFPQSGTVSCPATPVGDEVCLDAGSSDVSGNFYDAGAPAAVWDHVVVITGSTGLATVDWQLGDGENTLLASGCAIARPGDNEPNPPGEPINGEWGPRALECVDREVALTQTGAYDNGPADGFTPFEPVDTENEVGIFGLPIEFQASTCPAITVDGVKGGTNGSEWEACATKTGFSAPLKGSRKGEINAWFYSYDDGESLYWAVEVMDSDLGNRMFVQLAETYNGDGVPAARDDILVLDFADGGDPVAADWYLTEQCANNNASSLCGAEDTQDDGGAGIEADATVNGSPSGLFFEFRRPLDSPNNSGAGKEDLDASSGVVGIKITKTQGQGGGKGGFVFPDAQGPTEFFPIILQGGSQP